MLPPGTLTLGNGIPKRYCPSHSRHSGARTMRPTRRPESCPPLPLRPQRSIHALFSHYTLLALLSSAASRSPGVTRNERRRLLTCTPHATGSGPCAEHSLVAPPEAHPEARSEARTCTCTCTCTCGCDVLSFTLSFTLSASLSQLLTQLL